MGRENDGTYDIIKQDREQTYLSAAHISQFFLKKDPLKCFSLLHNISVCKNRHQIHFPGLRMC